MCWWGPLDLLDLCLGDPNVSCHNCITCNLFYSIKLHLKNISKSYMALSGVQKAVTPDTLFGTGCCNVGFMSFGLSVGMSLSTDSPSSPHANASGIQPES